MFVKLTPSCFEKSNAQNAFEHVRPKLNWLKSSSAAQIFFFIVASSDVRDSFPKKTIVLLIKKNMFVLDSEYTLSKIMYIAVGPKIVGSIPFVLESW